jgi:hypothetical protein
MTRRAMQLSETARLWRLKEKIVASEPAQDCSIRCSSQCQEMIAASNHFGVVKP